MLSYQIYAKGRQKARFRALSCKTLKGGGREKAETEYPGLCHCRHRQILPPDGNWGAL